MAIRLFTLGGLGSADDGTELDWLGSQWMRAALLVYLALERTATRDSLLALFWPETDADTARRRLNQTVFALRQALGDDVIESHGRALRAGARVHADVLEFERALADGRHENAIALYRGPFLAGVHLVDSNPFESWVDGRRTKYAREFRQACRAVVDARLASGDAAGAVAAAQTWVGPDPLDDEAQHRLIELLWRVHGRTEALKQYETYRRLLEADDLEPLDHTRELAGLIERQTDAIDPPPVMTRSTPDRPAARAVSPTHSPEPPRVSRQHRVSARIWAVGKTVYVGIAALGSIAALVAFVLSRGAEAPSEPLSLAIRPFREVGNSTGFGWLAAALEASLADALFGAPHLRLRATTAVAAYEALHIPDDSLARRLDVDFFIDGQIVSSGDSLTVTVQLMDAVTAQLLQLETIRQPMTASNERILEAVFSKVEMDLLPAIGQHVRFRQWRSASRNPLAVVFRHRAQERRWVGEAMLQSDASAAAREFAAADSLLAESQRLDPRWLEPRVARAALAARRANALRTVSDTAVLRKTIDEGLAHAEAVLAADARHTEALALHGRLLWRRYLWTARGGDSDWMLDSAEAELRRALNETPPVAVAAQDLSEILYMIRSSFAEAGQYAKMAYNLDAYLDESNLLINRIALTALHIGEDAEAESWCRTGLRRSPSWAGHHACLLEVMAWGNRPPSPDSAWAYYRKLVALDTGSTVRPHYLLRVAGVLARAGRSSEADNLLEQVRREVNEIGINPHYYLPWEAGVRYRMGQDSIGLRLFEEYRLNGANDAAVRAQGFPLRGYVPLARISRPTG